METYMEEDARVACTVHLLLGEADTKGMRTTRRDALGDAGVEMDMAAPLHHCFVASWLRGFYVASIHYVYIYGKYILYSLYFPPLQYQTELSQPPMLT